MKTRDDIFREHPLEEVLARRGAEVKGQGNERACKCMFHADKTASMTVNIEKQAWFCHACGFGGSVIDLISRLDGKPVAEVMKQLGGDGETWTRSGNGHSAAPAKPAAQPGTAQRPRLVKAYDYHDETGNLVYQACRLDPKSFRQRRPDPANKGKWLWNMEGVKRVLYRLPKVLAAKSTVWVVEGEKDADSLVKLGLVATTNVGGAGKWSEAYADLFKGKEVVLCGDNDEPGKKHIADILASLAGKAKVVRHVVVPAQHKDVSDMLDAILVPEEAAAALSKLYDEAAVFERGVDLPVQSMVEIEHEYRRSLARSLTHNLDFTRWLPTLGKVVRPMVAGEMIVIVADTKVGKTALLQNLAVWARPLVTLLFELELPGTVTFERFASLACAMPSKEVFKVYVNGGAVPWRETRLLDHVFTCQKSKLTPQQIGELVVKAELKIGERPALVIVDYMQLVGGTGSKRYEKASASAEDLKAVAKETNTIMVVASQVSRKHGEESDEVFLHDPKDSGSIENSCQLMLGAWRDPKDDTLLKLKVVANTKGRSGAVIDCNFDGERMLITERAKIAEEDVPYLEPEARL